jgi:hypothetical protein
MTGRLLASWRDGEARDAVVAFLERLPEVPVGSRLACFDVDGTLWCERPTYVQLDFLVDALGTAVRVDPSLRDDEAFAAVLAGNMKAVAGLGLERVAMGLVGLCRGLTPEEFTLRVRDFMARARNPTLHRLHRTAVYQPMLELLDELHARDVTVALVTGGGTEFVRAVSPDLYGVPPERVVGTMLDYDYDCDERGRPRLRRSDRIAGVANEGAAKVGAIQAQLGRRPIAAAGNSGGDREMLEWAAEQSGPTLALLVDHDDAEREFAYTSTAQTFEEAEPITDVGARLGWTVVSIARDWDTVFPPS